MTEEGSQKRKLQLNVSQCEELACSPEGAQPLVYPHSTKTSSLDPNRGLYPRPSRIKQRCRSSDGEPTGVTPVPADKSLGGFVNASHIYNPAQAFLTARQVESLAAAAPVMASGSGARDLPQSAQWSRPGRSSPKSSPGKRRTAPQRNKLENYFSYQALSCQESKANSVTDQDPSRSNSETGPDSSRSNAETGPDSSRSNSETGPDSSRSNSETGPDSSRSNSETGPDSSRSNSVAGHDVCREVTCTSSQGSATEPIYISSSDHDADLGGMSPLSSPSKRCTVMYSPIKQVGGASSIWQCSDASTTSLTHEHRDTKTVKRLFEGQKNQMVKLPAPTDAKSRKKAAEPKFNRANSFLYSSAPITPVLKTGDKYGLLGTGQPPPQQPKVNYFEQLPLEVVENILCRLPIMDLMNNLSVVCKAWHTIINDRQYLPWKKKYYLFLRGDDGAKAYMYSLIEQHSMQVEKPQTLLPGMISYYKNYKAFTGANLLRFLKTHPKYQWAEDLLRERLPDCFVDEDPDPWCSVAALVVLSESVDDITAVITCLLNQHSRCMAVDVIELLYSMACFLLTFKSLKYKGFWTGMHYRVYYALYLYENQTTPTRGQLSTALQEGKGQQSMARYSDDTSVRYTHEQLRICNHTVEPGEIIKIVAFAGTGKTTTLLRYTQLRPNKSFLLVVYNRSVKDHAIRVFPRNVACKTAHGLAFGRCGVQYSKAKKLRNLKVSEIVKVIQARKGISLFVQAKLVMNTINTFLASADRGIRLSHVPMEQTSKAGDAEYLGVEQRELLAEDARLVWSLMCDTSNRMVGMNHDGYLKLYQLSRPQLGGYDIILIDEAQDLTPAVADLLLSQRQAKVLVGDPHQQIYSFRGAVNAMEMVPATTTFYLTQSFRFGPEIAFLAATCLELLKHEGQKILVGNGKKSKIRGEQEGQVAIITRSNFTLFSEAVKKLCYSNEPVRAAFAGGTDSFGFSMILDIYSLLAGKQGKAERKIENPLIKNFASLGELESYAIKTTDNELLGKIRIVKTYTHSLPTLIPKIISKCRYSVENADLVFTTAHKAKGLEFSTVRLTDDFNVEMQAASSQSRPGRREASDEDNLLYVAVTRAKKALLLTPTLMRLLAMAGEQFRYPMHSKALLAPGRLLKCFLTDCEFQPCAITMERHTVTLGCGTVASGGLFCPQVVLEDMPALGSLYGALNDETDEGQPLERVHREPQWPAPWRQGGMDVWQAVMDIPNDDELEQLMGQMVGDI